MDWYEIIGLFLKFIGDLLTFAGFLGLLIIGAALIARHGESVIDEEDDQH